jgi:hypothetical protein
MFTLKIWMMKNQLFQSNKKHHFTLKDSLNKTSIIKQITIHRMPTFNQPST